MKKNGNRWLCFGLITSFLLPIILTPIIYNFVYPKIDKTNLTIDPKKLINEEIPKKMVVIKKTETLKNLEDNLTATSLVSYFVSNINQHLDVKYIYESIWTLSNWKEIDSVPYLVTNIKYEYSFLLDANNKNINDIVWNHYTNIDNPSLYIANFLKNNTNSNVIYLLPDDKKIFNDIECDFSILKQAVGSFLYRFIFFYDVLLVDNFIKFEIKSFESFDLHNFFPFLVEDENLKIYDYFLMSKNEDQFLFKDLIINKKNLSLLYKNVIKYDINKSMFGSVMVIITGSMYEEIYFNKYTNDFIKTEFL